MLQQQHYLIARVQGHQHHDIIQSHDEDRIPKTWPCYVLLPSLCEAFCCSANQGCLCQCICEPDVGSLPIFIGNLYLVCSWSGITFAGLLMLSQHAG